MNLRELLSGRFLPVPQEAMQPTTVVVNIHRDAESDAAAELFGERPK